MMMFARTVDAGPYVARSAGCPDALPCVNSNGQAPPGGGAVATSADTNVQAATAFISTHQALLCTGNTGQTSMSRTGVRIYPTVQVPPGSTYAEAGYVTQNVNGPVLQFYSEYADGVGHSPMFIAIGPQTPAPPNLYTYYVTLVNKNNQAGALAFNDYSSQYTPQQVAFTQTPFDPTTDPAWNLPGSTWVAAWISRTTNYGDDVPGTVANPTVFTSMQVTINPRVGAVPATNITTHTEGYAGPRYAAYCAGTNYRITIRIRLRNG